MKKRRSGYVYEEDGLVTRNWGKLNEDKGELVAPESCAVSCYRPHPLHHLTQQVPLGNGSGALQTNHSCADWPTVVEPFSLISFTSLSSACYIIAHVTKAEVPGLGGVLSVVIGETARGEPRPSCVTNGVTQSCPLQRPSGAVRLVVCLCLLYSQLLVLYETEQYQQLGGSIAR